MFNPKQNLLDQQLEESGLELKDFFKDLFTGGGYSRNKHAKKVADETNKYNEAVYKFEGEELKRQYDYAVEGQNIQKDNLLRDLQFQADTRQQQWNYGMAIRDHEYFRDMQSYVQSLSQAAGQMNLNQMAANFANTQADRYLMEQQIELGLRGQETLLNYATKAHGLALQKRKAKTVAAQQMRETGIATLKAKGQSAARGQAGRTSGKSLNAIQAEANAVEGDIINQLTIDEGQIDMDLLLASQENMQDTLALELTSNNLLASDRLNRQQILMQRAQADLQAQASIMIKPTIAPPLPKPLALPIPQFQDIYKPKQGPKPMKSIPYQANLGLAAFNTGLQIASFAAGGLTTGASGNITGFNLGKAFGVGS